MLCEIGAVGAENRKAFRVHHAGADIGRMFGQPREKSVDQQPGIDIDRGAGRRPQLEPEAVFERLRHENLRLRLDVNFGGAALGFLLDEDLRLRNKCVPCIAERIRRNSLIRAVQRDRIM